MKIVDKSIMESKIVYLQREETKTSQSFTLLSSKFDPLVDLGPVLGQIPDWNSKYFEIYCPQQDSYIPLNSICNKKLMVPRQNISLSVVLIRYSQEQNKQQQESPSEQNKKQRSRQRSIRQVIDLVQRWRQLHNPTSGDIKKLNLQEAAKIVGISKKSLDDYFFQLRMGQKYGFDFTSHIDCKVGLLRTFVKQKQTQEKKNGKHKISRHPKKLKLIQQFSEKLTLLQKSQIKIEQPQEQQKKTVMVQKNQIKEENLNLNTDKQKLENGFNLGKLVDTEQFFWGSPFSPIQQKAFMDFQNNFFKDFQNLGQQPNDPFVPYANFSKTKSIFGFDLSSGSSLGFI